MLLGGVAAYSQENRTEIFVDFRVNSTQIESEYRDNAARISELVSLLRQIQEDSTLNIVNVSFRGSASPEGSYEWNRQLAAGRLKTLEELVRSEVEIPDSVVTREDSYIPWEYLAAMVRESDISHKEDILDIIRNRAVIVKYYDDRTIDDRILRLRALEGGKVWKEMLRRFFDPMRNACAVFVTFSYVPPVIVPEPVVEEAEAPTDTTETVVPAVSITETVSPSAVFDDGWLGRLNVKTNVLGLGLGIANAAVEVDLCRHLSFNLPVYYSAWNYFTSTVKFRTLALQPEIRYWFMDNNRCNDGWFLGAHFGMAWYNIATGGDYRIQDHDGKSPALGGGLAVGYRMSISCNQRWKVEFSLGAGAYALHYDKFHNYRNGLPTTTGKKTYIGIDQASVSLSYAFDLKRKGGAR